MRPLPQEGESASMRGPPSLGRWTGRWRYVRLKIPDIVEIEARSEERCLLMSQARWSHRLFLRSLRRARSWVLISDRRQ